MRKKSILQRRSLNNINDGSSELTGLISNFVIAFCIIISPALISPLTDIAVFILCTLVSVFTTMMYVVTNIRLGKQQDMSGFLVVPLAISSFQNLYLGLMAPYANYFLIQLSLLLHVIFIFFFAITYFLSQPSDNIHPLVVLCMIISAILTAFGLFSVGVFKAPLVAMISSARNMLSPVLFLLVGLLVAERTDLRNFSKLVLMLAWATIVFGCMEYFFSELFWSTFNIEVLWRKKGIPNMATWGLPANFVSSEKFFGSQIRRMASSFADPVNFGTVLFLFFSFAWFMKQRLLIFICLVAIALTISKGAVLGLLIFATVWTFYSGSKMLFLLGGSSAAVMGIGIVIYAIASSTQSLMLHAQGLVTSLTSLPKHPFGRGLGGVGVLAEGVSENIIESGIGIMIGQLGLLAILLYGTFFIRLWRAISNIFDIREKVLGITLFLSILVNIAFNEVALSPNSCAGYFMALGLIVGRVGRVQASEFLTRIHLPSSRFRNSMTGD